MEEDETRTLKQICKRRRCEVCNEPATFQLTFLLPNARGNPASHGFGKDDISWYADEKMFVCDEHEKKRYSLAEDMGMVWCASFPYNRFKHLLLYWEVVRNDTST